MKDAFDIEKQEKKKLDEIMQKAEEKVSKFVFPKIRTPYGMMYIKELRQNLLIDFLLTVQYNKPEVLQELMDLWNDVKRGD
jgi:hypothetical protein